MVDHTRSWDAALEAHEAAFRRFLDAVRAVPADVWDRPPAPGKWTPCQVALHITMAYEAGLRVLLEGVQVRVLTGWWFRQVLRAFVMPRMLRTGRFPKARAPREVSPPDIVVDQSEVVERLHRAGRAFCEELPQLRAGDRPFMHPYFGPLTPGQAVRFSEIHALHHLAQLPQPDRVRP